MDIIFSFKVFIHVAETKKMTAAGESLLISQPAVSMQIKSLEDYYGVKLFSRTAEGLIPTQEGRIIYSHAKKILQKLEELNDELKVLLHKSNNLYPNKKINVGSCFMIGETYVPFLTERFMSEYPDISINCLSMDCKANVQSLIKNDLDVVFVESKLHHNNNHHYAEDTLNFEKIMSEELVIAVPAAFDIPDRDEIPLQLLIEKSYIAVHGKCGASHFLNQLLEKYEIEGMKLKTRAVFCSVSAVKRAVSLGYGWSILPRTFIAQEVAEGSIRVVRIKGLKKPVNRWVYVVYSLKKENSPAVKLFLEFARSAMLPGQIQSEALRQNILSV